MLLLSFFVLGSIFVIIITSIDVFTVFTSDLNI